MQHDVLQVAIYFCIVLLQLIKKRGSFHIAQVCIEQLAEQIRNGRRQGIGLATHRDLTPSLANRARTHSNSAVRMRYNVCEIDGSDRPRNFARLFTEPPVA